LIIVNEKAKDHKRSIHTISKSHAGPASTQRWGSGSKKDIPNIYEISKVKLHFLGGEQKGNNSGGCKIYFFFSL